MISYYYVLATLTSVPMNWIAFISHVRAAQSVITDTALCAAYMSQKLWGEWY